VSNFGEQHNVVKQECIKLGVKEVLKAPVTDEDLIIIFDKYFN
jgi:hypothetical protein